MSTIRSTYNWKQQGTNNIDRKDTVVNRKLKKLLNPVDGLSQKQFDLLKNMLVKHKSRNDLSRLNLGKMNKGECISKLMKYKKKGW